MTGSTTGPVLTGFCLAVAFTRGCALPPPWPLSRLWPGLPSQAPRCLSSPHCLFQAPS
ncbi:hypothetical protein AHAS_Ahas15G0208700 [Arachis hypogaea]